MNILLDVCKPTRVMKIGNYVGSSPQENANRAWEMLGRKMGFVYMTVRPIEGKGQRFISAVPLETEETKSDRLIQEAAEETESEKGRHVLGRAEGGD